MFKIDTFWVPSILMGIGIAIDVAIATIVMFRDKNLSFRSWTLPIMSTHIIFPGVGYYLVWGLGATFTPLQVILGFVGAALVAAFLYEATTEWRGQEPVFAISDWMGKKFEGRGLAWLTPAILVVSWDALWSGPAKAAQAVHWSTGEVLLSFLVAGIVVAVVAQIALAGAFWLRSISFASARKLAAFNLSGKFAEVSVIGGFGVLSFWNGLIPLLIIWVGWTAIGHSVSNPYEPDLYISIGVAAAMTWVFFTITFKELWTTELENAYAAIGAQTVEVEEGFRD